MSRHWSFLVLFILLAKFANGQSRDLELDYETAKDLAGLPLECYKQLYPFKFNNVWNSAEEVAQHDNYVPIFSGCFDWHSSVHGHWLLAALLNRYPGTELAQQIVEIFDSQFKVRFAIKLSIINLMSNWLI